MRRAGEGAAAWLRRRARRRARSRARRRAQSRAWRRAWRRALVVRLHVIVICLHVLHVNVVVGVGFRVPGMISNNTIINYHY